MGQRNSTSWRDAGTAAVLAACGLLAACILPDVDVEGRACPCADGYGCDTATNTCVKGDATSSPASTVSTSSGLTTTSGPQSSGSGQGDGGTGGTGEGAGGEGGSITTTSSSTGSGGEGGEGGEGGAGGSGGCAADQTTNVPMCGDFFDTFDDPDQFALDWSFTGSSAAFVCAESRFTITMTSSNPLAAYAPPVFDMVDCGLTVRLLEPPTAPDVVGRLSIAPDGTPTRFSIGVVDGTLQVREGDDVVVATDYDAEAHRYLRIREAGGSLLFSTSADGLCWDEHHDVETTDTVGIVGRLVLASDEAAAAASVVFDDYCYVPPG
jgi:hypothetical protein